MESIRHAAQRLGMSKEQEPARRKGLCDARDRCAHLFRLEIHQDIATEDRVIGRRLPNPGIVAREICGLDCNHLARGVIENDVAAILTKPLGTDIGRRFPQRPCGIARVPGFFQGRRINVQGANGHCPGRICNRSRATIAIV